MELLDEMHPNYEPLVANELADDNNNAIGDKGEEQSGKEEKKETARNEEGLVPPPPPQQEEKQALDLDEIAAMLMQKNVRGNINCIVEKKRNEELVDHAPRALTLPFGLNITTPPRLQHLTGEQMVVICKGDEDEESKEEKEEQVQQMIFPLPAHLLNQIQQVPQAIPIQQLLQQQQQQQQQQPQPQQMIFQQVPQQVMYQQQAPQPVYHQPHPTVYQQQQPQVMLPQPPQQIMYQQQPQMMMQQQPQQVYYPQVAYHQRQPQQVMDVPPRFQPQQEMIPLKEVPLNQEGIPMNSMLHHRVPINPLAIQDVPLSQMPLTHMPMKTEAQMGRSMESEGPVPVHHLVPPQPQELQIENFNQEEPRFNRPLFRERFINRPPSGYPASRRPMPPVDMREPRPMKMQRERIPLFPLPIAEYNDNNVGENREEFNGPVEGRLLPFPNPEMRPPFPMRDEKMDIPNLPPFLRDAERNGEPKIIRMIPLNFNERRPIPLGRRIRFPENPESDESQENRMPIITEITKIIPIRIEKEEPKINRVQMIPLPRPNQENFPEIKNIEEIDNKLEKLPERPFPIPIEAILNMIFKGIRPLMHGRSSVPIPIDIKIERIENKPIEGMTSRPIEIFEKEPQMEEAQQDGAEGTPTETNQPAMEQASQPIQPSTLMLDDIKTEKVPENKDEPIPVEAKVEQVEIVEKETEDSHPIPIPADAQDPQIFKLEDDREDKEEEETWEPRAFLPNGQGRGARVYPIPQEMREAEIFSVSDARAGKSMEIPMETSFTVEKPKEQEGRQGRMMMISQPEGEMPLFPLAEGRAMKPLPNPQIQLQSFNVNDGRSLRLLPVADSAQEGDNKPAVAAPSPNTEGEMHHHFVQPRSV